MGVIGTAGTNYSQAQFAYDATGDLNRTETPNGTIYRTVNDSLGQELSVWVGTNDASGHRQRPDGRQRDGQQHGGDDPPGSTTTAWSATAT